MPEPLIRQSPLTENWYVITKYSQKGDHITAHTKHDVTDQMTAIMSAADAVIVRLRQQVEQLQGALRQIQDVYETAEDIGDAVCGMKSVADEALRGES